MDTVRIPLHSRKYPGMFATVDAQDYERVSQYRWYPSKDHQRNCFYAHSTAADSVMMHRLIADAPDGIHVDHINGDGLCNCRANLRHATPSQNQQNKARSTRNTSGFRGVTWHKQFDKWQASITYNKKRYHLGLFAEKADAAHAYDVKARELFGEFARLNFPKAGER